MSLKRNRNSAFTYEELPLKSKSPHPTTRMIRLLPNENKYAEIECKLFIYDLMSDSGADSHLYEALSYVWGSNMRSRTIKVNNCEFPVTENLYLALLRLRNRQLERILWVDAICINQDDLDEKSEQIPLMRTIYAQAQHVTVWLGEAYEDGDKALEKLQSLAEGQDIDIEGCEKLCMDLFRRAWFRRIWVLQEVGVARFIYIMCGSVQINGHALWEGLKGFGLPSKYQEMIGPVAFLIKGALLRPKYEPGSRGTLTIGELVGMYCYHDATEQHDKIYALLGLSADPITPDLTPNYALPWNKVFQQVTNHIFPECSVETWPGSELAIIRGKGWALGHICSVRHVSDFGQQKVRVYLNDTARSMGYESEWDVDWELQTFARFFSPGDIVFLLQGASRPSIIRLCKDHFRIITPAVTICKRRHEESSEETAKGWNTPGRSSDILLAWRFPLNDDTGFQYWPERELLEMAPGYQEQYSEAENRRNIITQIMTGIVIEALALEKSEHDDIALLLGSSGTDIPIASKLAKASAQDIWHSSDRISQDFFQSEQGGLLISEGMLKVVAENNGPCGYIIMELLFQLQGASLPISEELFEAAARNSGEYGHQVMVTLYRHRAESFPISEEIVKAAAGNTGKGGAKILKTLFKAQGKAIPISEEVIKVAAGNTGICGPEIFKLIVQHRGKDLLVSDEVYKTAMANAERGYEHIKYLFKYWEKTVPISEELVKAAAGTKVWGGKILELFIQQGEKSLPISKEVIKIAARNWDGYLILELLYQHAEESLPISEDVVEAAAGNEFDGDRILKLLSQHADKRLPISEEVIETAAGSCSGYKKLELLYQHADESLPISEEVVKAAAGNEDSGNKILELLYQHADGNLSISEEAVKVAAGNKDSGYKILELLYQHADGSLPISEEVVKAAAGNAYSGDRIMELLFQQEGERLPVTEEVVKTAAGNVYLGVRIMEYLLQQKGRSGLPVTEKVLKAAATNAKCGEKIMDILYEKRNFRMTVFESSGSSESSERSESSLSSDGSDEED
ncbi:HET-domain-containing protein [Aspergillus phoenicis ATCC 13157]|uniref:HET-domain-containing protein n=1 Tax=Aspergillus phoenicis ATCC 13157 TaxID=1353007 RepID=A0A370PBQ5_ASPPH|nr:HET-domain-containing protein [Aspergillus phoenicis ATCC 13157]